MYKEKTVCVVVPSYNEETQIKRVVDTMPDCVDKIVIVDDKSKDKTVEVVKGLDSDKVVLLEHAVNKGVGGAIATGYKWARDNHIDVAVVMAGDGQMSPDDLPNILDPVVLDKADYSKANRLSSGEAYNLIPKIRYFGNSVLSLMTKIASGYWHVSDSQTGYTAINSKALNTVDWDTMYERYGQPNDLLVKLNVNNFRVCDVPTEPVYNVGEKSGIKVRKVMFTIGWLLVKSFFWRLKHKYYIRDFHPLIFFYLLAVILLTISAFLFVRLVWLWIQFGFAPSMTALALLFSVAMALQAGCFAMWLDSDYNKHLK